MNERLLETGAGVFGAYVLARWLARRRRALDLAGRSAIVTGGSRGLGLLIARELVRQGAKVAIFARDPADLEVARCELQAAGGDVIAVCCDVTDRESLAGLRRC